VAARVVDVVVAQADVLDLVDLVEDLVAVDRVDVADVPVIAGDAMLALVVSAAVQDAKVDVVEIAMDVENPAVVVLDVVGRVKGAQDVLDVEDLVLVRVHQKVKDHHAQLAIVVLDALVHVRHARRVEDAQDQADVVEVVLGVIWDVKEPVRLVVLVIVADVKDLVNRNAQLDARDALDVQAAVVDVQEAVVDAQDAVLDAMAHVLEHATGVVMDVVDNVKTHVLLPAQQRVQVPAKLKHLVP
jgi:hypothetical protein